MFVQIQKIFFYSIKWRQFRPRARKRFFSVKILLKETSEDAQDIFDHRVEVFFIDFLQQIRLKFIYQILIRVGNIHDRVYICLFIVDEFRVFYHSHDIFFRVLFLEELIDENWIFRARQFESCIFINRNVFELLNDIGLFLFFRSFDIFVFQNIADVDRLTWRYGERRLFLISEYILYCLVLIRDENIVYRIIQMLFFKVLNNQALYIRESYHFYI